MNDSDDAELLDSSVESINITMAAPGVHVDAAPAALMDYDFDSNGDEDDDGGVEEIQDLGGSSDDFSAREEEEDEEGKMAQEFSTTASIESEMALGCVRANDQRVMRDTRQASRSFESEVRRTRTGITEVEPVLEVSGEEYKLIPSKNSEL